MSSRLPRPLRRAFLAALLLGAASSTAANAQDWPNVVPRLLPVLHPALELARHRLEFVPSCALLLDDFQDSRSGRPLRDTLARTGLTPGAYLGQISFLDGSVGSHCADRNVLAHTPPGAPIVYVC